MTEPINLTQLREEMDDRAIPELEFAIHPAVVLALIDIAESAHAVTSGLISHNTEWPELDRLREALARTTTNP